MSRIRKIIFDANFSSQNEIVKKNREYFYVEGHVKIKAGNEKVMNLYQFHV